MSDLRLSEVQQLREQLRGAEIICERLITLRLMTADGLMRSFHAAPADWKPDIDLSDVRVLDEDVVALRRVVSILKRELEVKPCR